MAVDFLKRYPELCQRKNGIRKKIVYQSLLGHDLGEWKQGDVSLHSPKYHEKMKKNWERDDFIELQKKHKLPKFFLTLFDSFHDWKTTKKYRPESIFARFIDCYQGSLFYFRWSIQARMFTGSVGMVDEHIMLEMDHLEKRTITPLAYLRKYYKKEPKKLEALDRLHDEISEEIANFFGPSYKKIIKTRSRTAFENLVPPKAGLRG